jgi:hypothetical protein
MPLKRYPHSLSHHHLLTTDMGQLRPFMAVEVLPGDTFNMSTAMLLRVAPLATPVMHPIDVRVHFWYVPNRITWDNWDDFITGADSGVTTAPTVTPVSSGHQEIWENLGVDPQLSVALNAFPLYAYNTIWNEFYRDNDVQSEVTKGNQTVNRIAWGKDYFTTARPYPDLNEGIDIPFTTGQVPITGIGVVNGTFGSASLSVTETDGTTPTYANAKIADGGSANQQIGFEEDPSNSGRPNIYADLTGATGGIDINQLRLAMAQQRFAEARARFGDRYVDYLRFLGVDPKDARLQRPEYLGGGKQVISFSEVLATAEGTTTEVGDLFGHGIAALRTRNVRKFFDEHGWVLGLVSIRPKGMYMDSKPKAFTRSTRFDYWQPEMEVLPWQEVKESEIYAAGSDSTTFGHVPRHQEYRGHLSYVSGAFKDSTMNSWHLSRDFTSAPALNDTFIKCTPTDRVYSDTSIPEVIVQANNRVKAMRLVRKEATIGRSVL